MKYSEIDLFDKNGEWFRFGKYETEVVNGKTFVIPNKNAKLERYLPMESSAEILKDFYDFIKKIYALVKPYWSAYGLDFSKLGKSGKRKLENIYCDCAFEYCNFANKWGLLGIFWHRTYCIFEEPYKRATDGIVFDAGSARNPYYVLTNANTSIRKHPLKELNDQIPTNKRISLKEYSRLFSPQEKPINDVVSFEYGENIEYLLNNGTFVDIVNSFFNELQYCQIEGSLNESEKKEWKNRLAFAISPQTLYYYPENKDSSPIGWSFKSLLEAISIMHIMGRSRLGMMKMFVNVCEAKNCHRVFISDKHERYCTKNNANGNRKCEIAAKQSRHREMVKKRNKVKAEELGTTLDTHHNGKEADQNGIG